LLGLCNIGLFFPLLFLAAYRLPGGLASTLQATSPLAVMALAAVVTGERAGAGRIIAAGVGLVGVSLLVLRSPGPLDPVGLVAAFGSVVVSALGYALIKRWAPPVDMLTLVSWQLVVGGLAYWCWFTGLRAMPAGAVSLIGLINPVVGTGLGVLVAGEAFGWTQALGMLLVLGGVVAGQQGTVAWVRRRLASRRTARVPQAREQARVAAPCGRSAPASPGRNVLAR
jgi:probable blue pigment (indigoidine) exporter